MDHRHSPTPSPASPLPPRGLAPAADEAPATSAGTERARHESAVTEAHVPAQGDEPKAAAASTAPADPSPPEHSSPEPSSPPEPSPPEPTPEPLPSPPEPSPPEPTPEPSLDAAEQTTNALAAPETDTSDGEGEPDGASEPAEEERWAAFAPQPVRTPGRLRRAAAAVGRRLVHEWTLVTVGGLALAVLLTWPALRYPAYTLPQDLGDPALVSWILAWPGHILLTDPTSLWHGNAFYPDRWSYAYTDSLLGYAPGGMIGSGPMDAVFRYNVIFVLAFALAFIGGYALVRQLGAGRTAALVAGIAFAYAPWRLGQAGHLHVLSTGGIALSLAMLVRGHGWTLLRGFQPAKVRPGWIVAGWLVAAWQVTLGFGIGLVFVYVLALISVIVALAWLVRRIARRVRGPGPQRSASGEPQRGAAEPERRRRTSDRKPIGRVLAGNLIGGAIFSAVTILMVLPYLTVLEQHPQAQRKLEEVAVFSPPLLGFVTAPEQSWLWGSLHSGARDQLAWAPEMALLPGFALIGLALAGLVYSVWPIWARAVLTAGVAATVVLAMGTEFLGGAIYEVLYEWVPGWDALRTPGRLVIWTTLLLGVLAAGAIAAFVARSGELALARGYRQPGPWLRLAALLPAVLVLAEGLNTTPHEVVPEQPAALATAEDPVLVLPSDPPTDQLVMLWSTDGFKRVVNGGSGFSPVALYETRLATRSFPDQESVSYLRSLGVTTVVVLPDRVVGTDWEGALHATGDGLGITREEVGGAIVFRLGQ